MAFRHICANPSGFPHQLICKDDPLPQGSVWHVGQGLQVEHEEEAVPAGVIQRETEAAAAET
jgi:hypothetical protein